MPTIPASPTRPHHARREEIAAFALAADPAGPPPTVTYTDAEHEVWRIACTELAPKHARSAHSEYLRARPPSPSPRTASPADRGRRGPAPPHRMDVCRSPGLVALREFYGALGQRVFHSTQYLRHPSQLLYTPEPDVIHEVVGHANQLASPRFARLTEAAGRATARLETDAAVKAVADVFWFTMEFGVMREDGDVRPTAPASVQLWRDGRLPAHGVPVARSPRHGDHPL